MNNAEAIEADTAPERIPVIVRYPERNPIKGFSMQVGQITVNPVSGERINLYPKVLRVIMSDTSKPAKIDMVMAEAKIYGVNMNPILDVGTNITVGPYPIKLSITLRRGVMPPEKSIIRLPCISE